ncbi:hypothetical protein [Ferruginibacter sp. HRS2-29]|uniref:hypothetical protein n=1 Tax=Ferruginibacter sp. HRS2-29 TaxID=2487334 RepID=UPI0020CE62F5|nr:hypothetical protein [Ferruginibacter sp. HRS2-29]MCP9750488.1 hypothetical protein [Ferruginibacter sp. HRS2-29]
MKTKFVFALLFSSLIFTQCSKKENEKESSTEAKLTSSLKAKNGFTIASDVSELKKSIIENLPDSGFVFKSLEITDIKWNEFEDGRAFAEVKMVLNNIPTNTMIANFDTRKDQGPVTEINPPADHYTCSGVCIGCQVKATWSGNGPITYSCTCEPGCIVFINGDPQWPY